MVTSLAFRQCQKRLFPLVAHACVGLVSREQKVYPVAVTLMINAVFPVFFCGILSDMGLFEKCELEEHKSNAYRGRTILGTAG